MRKTKNGSASSPNIWLSVLFIIVFFVAFIFSVKIGIERQAKADCLKWQSWDKEYILFEPSAKMICECRTLGVDLKN